MTKRVARAVVLALTLIAGSLGAGASPAKLARVGVAAAQPAKVARVGVLFAGTTQSPQLGVLKQGLRDLGYVEGQNIVIDFTAAEGQLDRLPRLAAELVARQPDVIVAVTSPSVVAARSATQTIPIVMLVVGDPIAAGFVTSLAQPGGNVTGATTTPGEGLAAKRLQLLKEIRPGLARVAVLWNSANPSSVAAMQAIQRAATELGLAVTAAAVRGPGDVASALRGTLRDRPQALAVTGDPVTFGQRRLTADFARQHRLPSVYTFAEEAADGGLMSYGLDFPEHFRRAASFIDRILKGARPADMPVEQPTKFELVLNLKTARVLGLTVPPSLRVRADRVIE